MNNASIRSRKVTGMPNDLLHNAYISTLSLLQPLTLYDRYKSAVEQAVLLINADFGTIFLKGKNNDLDRVYSNVPRERQASPRKNGFTRKSVEEGKLYIIGATKLKRVHGKLYDKGIRSVILIPLSFNRQTIGVLSLQSHNSVTFSKIKENTLNLFGSIVSLGIRNSQLYEEMRDAVEARDLFISLASHELKTPLTTISAYADLVHKKVNNNEPINPHAVDVLRSEVRRLNRMLGEFLALEQIKTGQLKYTFQEVNIFDVVKKAVINFKFNYPGYKVIIQNEIKRKECFTQADHEKLQQAFTNLLNNAAKFSSSVTPIIIDVFPEDGTICVSITDYGKGIKKKEQSKVFQEFFKGSGSRVQGMGLGLYLVKNIIEKHKGEIILTSKLHKGTTITVRLPRKLYE